MNARNGHTNLMVYEPPALPGGWPSDAGGTEGESQQSLWALVNDRLRGRWVWMLTAGAVLAAVLAVLGFRSTFPTYRSYSALHIAPRIIPLIDELPESGMMPHYHSFLVTQMQYMQSRRVLELALEDEDLKRLSFARQRNVLGALERGVMVESVPQSELIYVYFESEDPETAQTVCDAIMNAYYTVYGAAGSSELGENKHQLYEIKSRVERELKSVQLRIQEILSRHGTTDLGHLQERKVEELTMLEKDLSSARAALERVETGSLDGSAQPSAGTLRQLEQNNPALGQAREMRDIAQLDFEGAQRRYRQGSPTYERARERYETAQKIYEDRYTRAMEEYEQYGTANDADLLRQGFFDGMSAARLQDEIGAMDQRREKLAQEINQIIGDMQRIKEEQFEEERIRRDYERVIERIQSYEVEGQSIASRITIAQNATWPHSTFRDGRKKRAIAGIVIGFAASFGAFFLLGTIDRRTFGMSQLQGRSGEPAPRCLGVLPDLGRSLDDPEASDIASHCVHQIRNQIEVLRDGTRGYVLATSSPFQGDGKTSIVMALGWSYAAAGYRTLLIDCDLVGRSLTRQLGLVGKPGLKEALVNRSLDGHAVRMPVEHLFALPVGIDARVGPETIRSSDLNKIFEQAREQYEIIIVDTGPLLGSLESTPVTSSSDGVVLSIRRGRSRTRLEECVRRLETHGANCIGVILNCVGRSECSRYVSDASLIHAEMERGVPGESENGTPVVRTPSGDRNVLMIAMENTARQNRDDVSEEDES